MVVVNLVWRGSGGFGSGSILVWLIVVAWGGSGWDNGLATVEPSELGNAPRPMRLWDGNKRSAGFGAGGG